MRVAFRINVGVGRIGAHGDHDGLVGQVASPIRRSACSSIRPDLIPRRLPQYGLPKHREVATGEEVGERDVRPASLYRFADPQPLAQLFDGDVHVHDLVGYLRRILSGTRSRISTLESGTTLSATDSRCWTLRVVMTLIWRPGSPGCPDSASRVLEPGLIGVRGFVDQARSAACAPG